MLADAIRSEAYRLTKSRTTWFWSVLFVPAFSLLVSVPANLFIRASREHLTAEETTPQVAAAMATGPVDFFDAMVSAAGSLANPIALLFILIGAATLYAGDYRWETWRLISARNTRANLVLGKVTVLAGLAFTAMIFLLLGKAVETGVGASLLDRPLTFNAEGGDAGRFLGLFALSWVRIIQFSLISLLAAVLSRSLLAALFVPLVLGVAQFFSANLFGQFGLGADSWLSILFNPGAAVDILGGLVKGGQEAALIPDGLPLKAWASLILWLSAPLAAALFWFQRQDLSKE